jgi:hypothetical protein
MVSAMSPPSTKKRKPNPFEESRTPSKKQRKQPKAAKDESFSPNPSTIVPDEIPFTLECPVRSVAKKAKKQSTKDDVFGPKEEDGGFPTLKIKYAIRPGKAWTDLKTYRNFSSKSVSPRNCARLKSNTNISNSVQNQKFSTGEVVYINKHTPPREPPDTDASEDEILDFDKQNLWVGQVLEVKASGPSQVWLRVFWLYWPEELPRGRQKYHGNQELIMSNHMEIVDAMAVASSTDINHWDEKVEDQDVGQRFWRQFFDVRLKKTKSGGLSTIRRHCVCNDFYNPDKTMLKCPNSKCGIWNHQECLEQAILQKTHEGPADDQNSTEAKVKPVSSSKAQLKVNQDAASKERNGQKPKDTPGKVQSTKNTAQQSEAWKGLLKAEIAAGEKGTGGALVTIFDERAKVPKMWVEGLQCLKCGTSID